MNFGFDDRLVEAVLLPTPESVDDQQFGEPGFFKALATMELYWERSMSTSEWSARPSQLKHGWQARVRQR